MNQSTVPQLDLPPQGGRSAFHIGKLVRNNMFVAASLTIALFIAGSLFNPNFLNPQNIGSIFTLAVIMGIASFGQTVVVISGGDGIDLSIGGSISLGAVMSALVMNGQNSGIVPALLLVIGTGILIGLVNSAGIILAKVPPLVMTMAVANILGIVQLIVCNGSPTGRPAPAIAYIGTHRIFPILTVLMIVGVVFMFLARRFLNNTTYGHQLFAVGNNDNAAFLSGARPYIVRMMAYILSGVVGMLTGFLLLGYNSFVFINMGMAYVLPSVAAVVIGGTSFAGGKGSFSGTMVGAILLTTLASLLIVINTDEAGRQIINGVALVLILALYTREPSVRQ
ncbi:MAG: transporter permease [Cohnella sp.]|nr:transporter permease [Cohnella sp.]